MITSKISYYGLDVNIYPANQGKVRIESGEYKQTLYPEVIQSGLRMEDKGKQYSVVFNQDNEPERGVRL